MDCMKKMNIEFVETKPVDLKGYTLIEGFPGVGLVGTIAAKYLVEKLDMKEVGYMHADALMPIIRIHQGLPIHPSRVYVNESRKLVVLVSEQVIPKEYVAQVAHAVVDWVVVQGIERVVSLSGIGPDATVGTTDDKFRMYGMAANEASKKWLLDQKVELIQEGITTGVTALTMLEMREHPIQGVSLLGSVKMGADYKATAELLKQLSPLLKLDIDVEPLIKEAKETEKELMKQIQKLQTAHKNINGDDQTPMYT